MIHINRCLSSALIREDQGRMVLKCPCFVKYFLLSTSIAFLKLFAFPSFQVLVHLPVPSAVRFYMIYNILLLLYYMYYYYVLYINVSLLLCIIIIIMYYYCVVFIHLMF